MLGYPIHGWEEEKEKGMRNIFLALIALVSGSRPSRAYCSRHFGEPGR